MVTKMARKSRGEGRDTRHASKGHQPDDRLTSPPWAAPARAVICKRWATYSTAPGTAESHHTLTQVWVLPDSGRFTMSSAQGLYLTCLTQSGQI
jgi:hypothetical protein